jgi:hypothetical protein
MPVRGGEGHTQRGIRMPSTHCIFVGCNASTSDSVHSNPLCCKETITITCRRCVCVFCSLNQQKTCVVKFPSMGHGITNLIWKRIFTRSIGAITVREIIPANPPAITAQRNRPVQSHQKENISGTRSSTRTLMAGRMNFFQSRHNVSV